MIIIFRKLKIGNVNLFYILKKITELLNMWSLCKEAIVLRGHLLEFCLTIN